MEKFVWGAHTNLCGRPHILFSYNKVTQTNFTSPLIEEWALIRGDGNHQRCEIGLTLQVTGHSIDRRKQVLLYKVVMYLCVMYLCAHISNPEFAQNDFE